MQPRTGDSLLAQASRPEAISFIGDARTQAYAGCYIERPEAFARPFFAAAYSFPELSCANVFPAAALHPDVAHALQNEGSRPPLKARTLTDDDRIRRAFARNLLSRWQHGYNVTNDPVVVFVIGLRDVLELSEMPSGEAEAEIALRAGSLSAMIRSLSSLGYSSVYVHGIEAEPQFTLAQHRVAASLDGRLREAADGGGGVFLEAAAPERVLESILADRIGRRSQPLPADRRIAVSACEEA